MDGATGSTCMFSPCHRGISLGSKASSHSPNMQVRLTDDFELPVSVYVSVNGCLFLCVSCVIVWRPVQGCTRPLAQSAGIGSSPLCDPEQDKRLRIMKEDGATGCNTAMIASSIWALASSPFPRGQQGLLSTNTGHQSSTQQKNAYRFTQLHAHNL